MEFKDFLSLHTFLFFFHLSVIHMHINTHTHTRVPGEYACKRLPEIPCDCHPMGLCSRMIWFSQLPFFVSLTHAHRFSHTQANTRLDNQDGSSFRMSLAVEQVCASVCERACAFCALRLRSAGLPCTMGISQYSFKVSTLRGSLTMWMCVSGCVCVWLDWPHSTYECICPSHLSH